MFFLGVKFLLAAVSQQVFIHTTENDYATSEVNDADFGAAVLNACWPDSFLSVRWYPSPREEA